MIVLTAANFSLQNYSIQCKSFREIFASYLLRTAKSLFAHPYTYTAIPEGRLDWGWSDLSYSSSRLQFRARSTIWPCNLKCCNSKHFETQTRRRFVSLPCLQCIYISLLLIPSLRHFCLFGTAAPVCKTGKATKCYYPTSRNKMTRFCMRLAGAAYCIVMMRSSPHNKQSWTTPFSYKLERQN